MPGQERARMAHTEQQTIRSASTSIDSHPSAVPSVSIDDTLRQVFLSPRVIDQRSVDELSETLRGLIREAATQSRSLLCNTGEVKGLSAQLRSASQDLQQRVDEAGRVVPAIDERVAKVEGLLEQAGQTLATRLDDLKSFITKHAQIDTQAIALQVKQASDQAIQDAVQTALRRFEERTEAMLGPVFQRFEHAGARLNELIDRAEQVQDRLTHTTDRAEAASLTASHAVETTENVLARVATATQQARTVSEATCAQASATQSALSTAAEAHAEQLAALTRNAVVMLESLGAQSLDQITITRDGACDAVSARTHAIVAGHANALRAVAEESHTMTRAASDEAAQLRAEATATLAELRSLMDAATPRLATFAREIASLDVEQARRCVHDTADAVTRATDAALQLREATTTAQHLHIDIDGTVNRLGELRKQAEGERTSMGEALQAGALWLDSMRTQVEELRVSNPLTQAQDLARNSEDTLAKLILRADRIGSALDRLMTASSARLAALSDDGPSKS